MKLLIKLLFGEAAKGEKLEAPKFKVVVPDNQAENFNNWTLHLYRQLN